MESIAWKAKEIYGTAKTALTNDESVHHTHTLAVHTHVVSQAGVKHDSINNG